MDGAAAALVWYGGLNSGSEGRKTRMRREMEICEENRLSESCKKKNRALILTAFTSQRCGYFVNE